MSGRLDAGAAGSHPPTRTPMKQGTTVTDLIGQILETTTFRRRDVEAVLGADGASWCRFDPEIGYVPRDIVLKDGIDFSHTTYSHEPTGQRRMVNYRDRPCRINTYGDSFTQCQQVSDDESWQERLAAHLGEPIRNFGCGGHSLYAAYLRALRTEDTSCSAEYVVLTVYDDDHVRNLDASRWLRTNWNDRHRPADRTWPLHGLPWSHVRFDLSQNRFVELPGACRTGEDLLALCDKDHFRATFADDQILRLFALEIGGEADFADLEAVAEALGIDVDLRDARTRRAQAAKLRRHYGMKASRYILGKLQPWLRSRGKKLLVPLAYGEDEIVNFLKGGDRFDASFVDDLTQNDIPFFDMLEVHKADYANFRISPEQYVERFYIKPTAAAVFGHYTPMGNLFFAMALKDRLVSWVDPKPHAYR